MVVNSDFYLLFAGLRGYSCNSLQEADNQWGPQMFTHKKNHDSRPISKETHEVHNIAKYICVTLSRGEGGGSELRRGTNK